MQINTDKTRLIWIGKKHNSKDEIDIGNLLTWGETTFNLLGVNFSVNLNEMIHINFTLTMKKLEHLFHVWNQKYLTLSGRITVIKAFALSKLNHLFFSLPSPGIVNLKNNEGMFFKFIQKGKPDKIKWEILTKKYLDGGLNMLNLHNFVPALKITWLHCLYQNPEAPWAKLARTFIGPYEQVILLGSIYSKTIARKIDNKFWKEILDSWSALIEGLGNHRKDLSLPIWYNTQLSNRYLYCPKWYKAGIISIADLLTSNGDILPETDLNTI